jgi:glycine/D-amino acid oxidase-like deaminating enzyme
MTALNWPASLWHDSLSPVERDLVRPALPGDSGADVVIVGAGYTGLWTAYYLLELDPSLRVVIVEASRAGFGASGRNGGWCAASLPMGFDSMAKAAGGSRDAVVRLQRQMNETVTEVGRVASAEGIDCAFHHGGSVYLARTKVQAERIRAEVEHQHAWGFGDDDHRWLSASEASARLNATNVIGGSFTPHCARIHPARLVRGLAHAIERLGGVIYEGTGVTAIESGKVTTDHGVVRAPVIVRATEGYTSQIESLKRAMVPVYSLMIATEPLSDAMWDEIGCREMETFNDERRLVIYGQRTWDNRIAFGGRGAPYHWGSRIDPGFDQVPAVHELVRSTLVELFPMLDAVGITHRWGGPLGIPRDWFAHIDFDRASGLASAGGYVGVGVGASNLAGRTMADLITGTESERTDLPWVNHQTRQWEREPLRWIGVNGMVKLNKHLDGVENRTGKVPKVRAKLMSMVVGDAH